MLKKNWTKSKTDHEKKGGKYGDEQREKGQNRARENRLNCAEEELDKEQDRSREKRRKIW